MIPASFMKVFSLRGLIEAPTMAYSHCRLPACTARGYYCMYVSLVMIISGHVSVRCCGRTSMMHSLEKNIGIGISVNMGVKV